MLEIGSRYYEQLCTIKRCVTGLREGDFQEWPETFVEVSDSGKCYYDKCECNSEPADNSVLLVYDNGRNVDCRDEIYRFHSECLEKLLKDKRFSIWN